MPVGISFDRFHHLALELPEQTPLEVFEGGIRPAVSKKEAWSQDTSRVWSAFIDAAHEQYGRDRVERVWRSYQIDPHDMIRRGKPPRVSHIHMIEEGTAGVTFEDLQKKINRVNVSGISRKRIVKAVEKMVPYRRPFPLEATQIHGAPTRTTSFFSYDPYLMDQELHALLKDVGRLSKDAYIERLCKAVSSRELPEGMLIPAPRSDKRGQIEYLVVHKTISKGDGLVAYALKPLSKQSSFSPMVIFRSSPYHPSGLDFLETWLNNMQSNMGWLGYQTARGALVRLAYDPDFCPLDKKFEVHGYSLGGAHAQLFMADCFERVKEATFYNDPSIDAETAEMFATKVNALAHADMPMKVRIYRTKGDVANCAGGKHLFWGVRHPQIDCRLIEFSPEEQLSAKTAHGWRIFDCHVPQYVPKEEFSLGPELDDRLNNRRRGPDAIWYENKRLIWGSYFVYPILLFWSRLFQFIEHTFNIPILRHTPREIPEE